MKKLNILITLLVSSFFLFTSGVKADTLNINIDSTSLNRINNTFFKVRESAINLANSENKDYIITYSRVSGASKYQVYLFDKQSDDTFFIIKELNVFYLKTSSSLSYTRYTYETDSLLLHSQGTNGISLTFINNTISYSLYLDTSLERVPYISEDTDFIFNYNNISYLITTNSHVPSLYELYLGYEPPQQEETNPKAEIITNFYILTIEKIQLLANYIATDYVLLSSVVILILIFIIYLIRRCFL